MAKELAMLCYTATALANDMKHVHFHAIGPKFDRIHSICQEYYDKASSDADELGELAMEYGQPVQNLSYASEEIGYTPTNHQNYSWEEAMNIIHDCIDYYIEQLEKVLATPLDSDVENLLQEYLRYWKKENNYKNRARMKDV